MSAGRGRGIPQQPQYNAMYQDIAQMSLHDPNIQLSNQLRQMLLSQDHTKNTNQSHNIMMNPPMMAQQTSTQQNMFGLPQDNSWIPLHQVMPQGITMSNMFNTSPIRQSLGSGHIGQSLGPQTGHVGQSLGGHIGQSLGSQTGHIGQSLGSQTGHIGQSLGSQTGHIGQSLGGHIGQSLGPQTGHIGQSLGSQTGHIGQSLGAQTGPIGQSLFKSSPSTDMSGEEFLQSLMKCPPQRSPHNNAASAVSSPPIYTNLSVAASEFVPCFRKPEKQIVLYTYESFRKKSKADDENAINDVKTKLVKLFNSPQDVKSVMEPTVETIKSWTTSETTYHQIVEDVFEFSIDEVHQPNFYHIGSKVLGYFTLMIPPYGKPPLTFFDAIIHKCCREYDNCLREDLSLAKRQHRARHVALMIAELFTTIKEGDLRVFVFAEQIVHLCHLLTQCPSNSTVDAVAKIMLVCGRDLKDLVDDDRFGGIINSLSIIVSRMASSLDCKTVMMVENVVKLNKSGWAREDDEQQQEQPVTNEVDWNEYATDEFDDQWLNDMLRFEEEDDFSDVEEDFKKFMQEAQKNKS